MNNMMTDSDEKMVDTNSVHKEERTSFLLCPCCAAGVTVWRAGQGLD
jgi:hypothetical protein